MIDKIIETQYDLTKRSKLRTLYEKNKFLFYSIVLASLISVGAFFYYVDYKEEKKIIFANDYMKAKLYLHNNEKDKAKKILKKIILKSNSTYSTMSLFLILNNNLIIDQNELYKLFDHVLENYKFEKEIKNLIIYKKLVFQSNFATEAEMLELIKPIINSNSLWKPQTLMLISDFFISKKEYIKANEFLIQILSINNANQDLYHQAKLKLSLISNE